MATSATNGTTSTNSPTTTATPTTDMVGFGEELVVGTRVSNGGEVDMSGWTVSIKCKSQI